MAINAALFGQFLFVLAVIIILLTIIFAKGKSSNLWLVGLFAVLMNFLFPPAGWIYCAYWSFKDVKPA